MYLFFIPPNKVVGYYSKKINMLINLFFMDNRKKFLTFAVINTMLITYLKGKLLRV